MNKELLHELFEYKNGNLIYKISTAKCIKIGEVAGNINTNGYRRIVINKKVYQAHRLIWMFHNGDIETGLQIDHINQIKDDNRIENLRLATRSQNKSKTQEKSSKKDKFEEKVKSAAV